MLRQLCILLIVAFPSVACGADYEKADMDFGLQLRNASVEDVKVKIEAENNAIKTDDKDPEPHVRKALAYGALAFKDAPNKNAHWVAAIDCYKEALKRWQVIAKNKDDKRQPDAAWRVARIQVYLGYAYVETAKYDDAEAAFKEAAEHEKMTALVKFGRDYLMMKKGK